MGLSEAYVCGELLDHHDAGGDLHHLLVEHAVPLIEVAPHVMEKAAYRQNPEGVIAVATPPAHDLADLMLPERALVLVLEDVEKPGNLGAVVRTASGAGVHAVLACGVGADPWNPNCLRASTGAVFTVPTIAASREEIVAWLHERGLALVATTLDTDTVHTDLDLTGAVAILMGAEDTGLSPALLEVSDHRCRIPMQGAADSLNVSVAAAILVYEALRQRSLSP